MKRYFLLLLVASGYCYGQNEFAVHDNGLIYDEETMCKLGVIVDSLNVKFRMCDMAHPYYSFSQGVATYVEIPNKGARKMIENGITLKEYNAKYSLRKKGKKTYIIKTRYKDYDDTRVIEYAGLPSGRGGEFSIILKDKKTNDKSTGWVINEEGSAAFYLEGLKSTTLPLEYARQVQYVDCMIDTIAEIYLPHAIGEAFQTVREGSTANEFIQWTENYPGKPDYPDYDKIEKQNLNFDSVYTVYNEKKQRWDSLRMQHLDTMMSTSAYWRDCLAIAVDESLSEGNSDDRFEFYVARYHSKQDALKLMRSRRVIGRCSQDQSPRYHAMNICKLAAETAQWDIFLRSHLDIMNDRFERRSDGSYAWAGRKTYLKELEELDINAVDLLLGTCLRVENVSEGHYWGSIGRIGRALTDAENKKELEDRLLTAMKNDKLDSYNRLLIAYLFNNYAHNLSDEKQKHDCLSIINDAMITMPEEIKAVWVGKEEN